MPDLQEFIFVIRPTRVGMLTEGPTEREAGIMLDDPAVRHGVMSANLYPFKIVLQGT